MKVPLDELQKAEYEFINASTDIDAITTRLEKVVKNLDTNWEDAGKQIFYKYYLEWHNYICNFSQLLDIMAKELNIIRERYQEADSSIPKQPE